MAAGVPQYTRPAPRPASFWIAWVLGFLLIGSIALNLLLFFLFVGALGGSALEGAGPGFQDFSTIETYVLGERSAREKFVRIDVQGVIGGSQSDPLGRSLEPMQARITRYLDRAAKDSDVKGVLLFVDSPGGGVTESDMIHAALLRFREKTQKPVVAYFQGTAASGGYYVAMATEYVVAQATCITGSIGVILGTWNYSEASKKLGLERITILSKRTPYKDILSGDRPMRAGEREILTNLVDEMYDRFVSIVDQGRKGLDRDEVVKLADGRIYSGSQAKALGLVDELGGIRAAIRWLEKRTGATDAKLVRYEPRPGLLETLLSARAKDASILQQLGLPDPSPKLMYLWTGSR